MSSPTGIYTYCHTPSLHAALPIFNSSIDQLGVHTGGAIVVPVGLILASGAARVFSLLFSELRDAVFARVGQHAIRAVGLQIFRHLHALALRFHLSRQTGGLTRAIERGTRGIQTLLSFLLFKIGRASCRERVCQYV